ncbi:MAG: UDP-N-acetylmuramate--L-alanine ligase, partial [Aquincola sp.]|nr:UDP-N-acetylmuramate--L-alanine ligase [Aquincola sp.]
ALRLAGRVEPLFVPEVAALPDAIITHARGGDVVLCMGAGSIGGVSAQVVQRMQQQGAQEQKA